MQWHHHPAKQVLEINLVLRITADRGQYKIIEYVLAMLCHI
jgi:hypothetical protein